MRSLLPPTIPGRRTGRRVTTKVIRDRPSSFYPGLTFDILVCYGATGGWHLPREFTVFTDQQGTLRVIHEWSRK